MLVKRGRAAGRSEQTVQWAGKGGTLAQRGVAGKAYQLLACRGAVEGSTHGLKREQVWDLEVRARGTGGRDTQLL